MSKGFVDRWGGGVGWKVGDGNILLMGETIAGEGPGKGWAALPWCMDKYERVMALRPQDTWLLKRLLKHAWNYDGEVFISQRLVSIEARVARNTVHAILDRLTRLGYIERLSDREGDDRNHYSVKGFYAALAQCVGMDPASKWSQTNGSITHDEARAKVFQRKSGENVRFKFDMLALKRLVARNNKDAR